MTTTTINVAIIEDQRTIREGLAWLIDGTPGYHCLGSYASMEAALARIGDALARTDVAKLDRLFADSYVVTQGNGSQATKASLMEAYKSGSLKYSAASYRDLKIKAFGETAVTTAILTLNGHNTGGDFTINAPITNTWVKQSGYWRLVSAHLSPNLAQK